MLVPSWEVWTGGIANWGVQFKRDGKSEVSKRKWEYYMDRYIRKDWSKHHMDKDFD